MTVLLRGSGRPLVLIALATVVLVAAWLHGWWFPWFLSGLEFVGANSETISGLGGLFQTLEILVGFLLLVFGGAGLRQATQTSSGSGQNMIAGGNIEKSHYKRLRLAAGIPGGAVRATWFASSASGSCAGA